MLKKLIFIVLLSSCIGGISYSYLLLERKTHLNTPVINCVPKDAALIFHIKKPLHLWSSLTETNLIWDNLKEIDFIKKIDISLKEIDSTIQYLGIQKEKQILISIHQGNETPYYLIAFSSDQEENKTINTEINASKNTIYNTIPIFKKEKGKPIYTCYISPFTIISTNQNILQKSIDQLQNKNSLLQDSSFNNLYIKTNKNNNLQLYLNASNLKRIAIPYLNKSTIENWKTNNEWSSLDVIIDNNQILLNGLAVLPEATQKSNSTRRIDINLLPTDLKSISEYSFEKDQLPSRITNTINSECNCNSIDLSNNWIENHLTEIVFGNKQDEKAYYLTVKESEHIFSQVRELIPLDSSIINSYGKELHQIKSASLNILLNLNSNKIYCCIENSQLVISTLKGLKQLTYEWKKNKNTKPSFNYSIFSKEHLAQKVNFNWFTTSDYLSKSITTSLKTNYQSTPKIIAEQLKHSLQVGYQTNQLNTKLEHIALIIKTLPSKSSNDNELWELTLEAPIYKTPQLLKNHKSKSLDIFVQDSTNTIHLINAAGRIKWSKKIEGKIIGSTQQIDVYANNKYQLIFNTATHIHVLDINGHYVKGFPLKLENKATSPISIFDYDQTSNYRFWISCENLTTYNYDKEGKKVIGWNMPKSLAPIYNQFSRTVFNQKDYIYNIDIKGNAYFLNRRGESIYNLDQPLVAKDNTIVLQKRASLSSSSFIYQQDSSLQLNEYSLGNSSQKIKLDQNHPLLTYQIIDLDNNNYLDYLAVFQNKIEIYGMDKTILRKSEFLTNVEHNYTLIKANNGKYYLVIKTEDTDNLIILDAHLNQINNSIITGSLNLTIGDINSDDKINVVTIINKETLKVYSIN